MKYLKSTGHYENLYDLFTIEDCLRLKKQFSSPAKVDKKIKASEKEKMRAHHVVKELFFYYTKGERFKKKAETISKWIEADKLRDEIIEWKWFDLKKLPKERYFPSFEVIENYIADKFYIKRKI